MESMASWFLANGAPLLVPWLRDCVMVGIYVPKGASDLGFWNFLVLSGWLGAIDQDLGI